MKRVLIVLISAVLIISFLIPNAWAGSKQRHRWEGVAIGLGAAALLAGPLLFHHHYTQPAYCPPPQRHRAMHRPGGHWEIRKFWCPPRTERVWHEGYYDHCGRWIPGYWEERCQPGYWQETRVWVSHRHW
jgi:hypothetical protein